MQFSQLISPSPPFFLGTFNLLTSPFGCCTPFIVINSFSWPSPMILLLPLTTLWCLLYTENCHFPVVTIQLLSYVIRVSISSCILSRKLFFHFPFLNLIYLQNCQIFMSFIWTSRKTIQSTLITSPCLSINNRHFMIPDLIAISEKHSGHQGSKSFCLFYIYP